MAREYRSAVAWRGMPIVHVALGVRGAGGRYEPGRARGVIAVGNTAVGVIAVGLVAVGVVAVAPVALGVVALGAVAVGVVANGAVAVGIVAVGAVAVGVRAVGVVVAGGATTKLLALPLGWWRGTSRMRARRRQARSANGMRWRCHDATVQPVATSHARAAPEGM